ncbi:hypothetical protein CKO28_18800 [Rhodovibrio sodomensis]|uniref:Uncharacterized protein n=1 Tax=Rhodovibrio sodomensis TaxID=1088 RepID=A0ABS1DK44_9PROT|nr:hypothetical protein [Rhodovibrio sodomensis]MBK1670088.1 hypothetical protein [Rhodovibrio sodomensis]
MNRTYRDNRTGFTYAIEENVSFRRVIERDMAGESVGIFALPPRVADSPDLGDEEDRQGLADALAHLDALSKTGNGSVDDIHAIRDDSFEAIFDGIELVEDLNASPATGKVASVA